MTTIVKLHFFKPLLFIFLTLLFFSCRSVSLVKEFDAIHQNKAHSRALDINDNYICVAGSNGHYTIYNTEDYKIIEQDSIEDAEDIRDLKILPNGQIVFLNSGNNGFIWKRKRDHIEKVFKKDSVFLDGLSFWDEKAGIAYGDPVDNDFFILTTGDAGENWEIVPADHIPDILKIEAGFAASGTGDITIDDSIAYIVTGISDTARMFRTYNRGATWDVVNTPMKSGESYGIYSTYFWSEDEGVIIGGSYLNPHDNKEICYSTVDGGASWEAAFKGLGGYCSCVHGTDNGDLLVATGRTGTFYSLNKGESWETLFEDTYYTVHVFNGRIYFSGKNGQITVYSYQIK